MNEIDIVYNKYLFLLRVILMSDIGIEIDKTLLQKFIDIIDLKYSNN